MIVVDANILIRAVLGIRVRSLIMTYGPIVDLFAPTRHGRKRGNIFRKSSGSAGVPVEAGLSLLNSLEEIIQPVEFETYRSFEPVARTRLASRDPDDWPVLATALALRFPIWTEDNDFFVAGIATWTTDRVELFLSAVGPQE